MLKEIAAALLALCSISYVPQSHNPNLVSAKIPVATPKSKITLEQFLSEPVAISDAKLQGIRLVRCIGAGGMLWSGSMVHYNSNNQYLTAAHVADAIACFDAATKTPLKVNYIDRNLDFAIFYSPTKLDNVVYKLSCQHFRPGHKYHALGWAGGDDLTSQDLVASTKYSDKWFIIGGAVMDNLKDFDGYIIAGQSGGAVVDEKWIVYGINNASDDGNDESWSRELADTPLCK